MAMNKTFNTAMTDGGGKKKNAYGAWVSDGGTQNGASGAMNAEGSAVGGGATNNLETKTYGSWLQDLQGKIGGAVNNFSNKVGNAVGNLGNAVGNFKDYMSNLTNKSKYKNLGDIYEEQRDNAYETAEKQRMEAEQRADIERERNIVDARSSYEQNKASYGTNAEAMGSMGLSGSGYSDYLDSKAYAQQRADIQAAKAQADSSKRDARYIEDQAKLQADKDYYKNIVDEASDARKDYLDLLSGANSGAYTAAQIEQLAADYGLSYEQKQSLINAANEYTTKKQAEFDAELYSLSGSEDIEGYLKALVDSGSISAESAQRHLYNEYKNRILNATDDTPVDTSIIYEAGKTGRLSKQMYYDLEKMWNNKIDIANFFTPGGKIVEKSEARKALDDILKNPMASEETKQKLVNNYNFLYGAT